jgi:DNA replication protein DnaD
MTMIQDTLQFEDFQATSSHSKSEIAEILYKIEQMLKNEPQIAKAISADLDKTSNPPNTKETIKRFQIHLPSLILPFPKKQQLTT